MSLALGACQGSNHTPAPAQSTPTATPTTTPAGAPTPAATPTLTATPTATPTASDTPTASPSPTAAPTLLASAVPCTGSDTMKKWFADQVPLMGFDVYCAVLPSGLGVVKGQVDYDKGGLVVQYKNAAGNTVDVYEGSFCSMSPNPCSGNWTPVVGNTAFGPLTGELDGSSGLWSITVHTSNPKVMYAMVGSGMDQAAIASYAAAMHKVS